MAYLFLRIMIILILAIILLTIVEGGSRLIFKKGLIHLSKILEAMVYALAIALASFVFFSLINR